MRLDGTLLCANSGTFHTNSAVLYADSQAGTSSGKLSRRCRQIWSRLARASAAPNLRVLKRVYIEPGAWSTMPKNRD